MTPQEEAPSIDVAKYETLLQVVLDLEEEHEKAGWDNTSPTLYRVRITPGQSQYESLDRQFGSAQQFCDYTDFIVEHPETTEARDDLTTPGPPTLIAFIFEGWMNPTLAAEQWLTGGEGRTIANFPGTEEARFVLGMSDDNRLIGFFRKKGEDLLTHHIFKEGRIFTNLRRIHRAIHAYWRQKK